MFHARRTQIIIGAGIFTFAFVGAYYYIVRESQNRAEEAARNYYIVPQQEWSQPFVDLLEDAKQQDIKVDSINVYWCDYTGIGYWVSEASPEFLAMISKRLKLQPVEDNHEIAQFFSELLPKIIEAPSPSSDICYYLCPNCQAGEKGDRYCVMFDKANKVVIVRYYFNW